MSLRDKLSADNPSAESAPSPLTRGEKLALAQQIRAAHPAPARNFGVWFKPVAITAMVALVAAGGAAFITHTPNDTVRVNPATSQPPRSDAVSITLGGQQIMVHGTTVPEGYFGVHGSSLAANHAIDEGHRSTQESLGSTTVTYVGADAGSFSLRYQMSSAQLQKTSLGALQPYFNLAQKGDWQKWADNPTQGLPAVVALAQQAQHQDSVANQSYQEALPASPRLPQADNTPKEQAWSALTQWLQYPGFTAKDRASMLTLLFAAGDGAPMNDSVVQEVPGKSLTQQVSGVVYQDAKRHVMVDPTTGYLTGSARVLPGADFLDETGIDNAMAFNKPVQQEIKAAHLNQVKNLLAQGKCTFEQGTVGKVTVQQSLCTHNEPTIDPNTGKPMTPLDPNAANHWQLP